MAHTCGVPGCGLSDPRFSLSRWPILICPFIARGVSRMEEKPAPFTKPVKSAAPAGRLAGLSAGVCAKLLAIPISPKRRHFLRVFSWPARPDESSSRTDHRLSRWRACHIRCKRALKIWAGIHFLLRISFASPSLPPADARATTLRRTLASPGAIVSLFDIIKYIVVRCKMPPGAGGSMVRRVLPKE